MNEKKFKSGEREIETTKIDQSTSRHVAADDVITPSLLPLLQAAVWNSLNKQAFFLEQTTSFSFFHSKKLSSVSRQKQSILHIARQHNSGDPLPFNHFHWKLFDCICPLQCEHQHQHHQRRQTDTYRPLHSSGNHFTSVSTTTTTYTTV